jgi:hypothetical protein
LVVSQDLVSNKQTTSWNHNSWDTLQVAVIVFLLVASYRFCGKPGGREGRE